VKRTVEAELPGDVVNGIDDPDHRHAPGQVLLASRDDIAHTIVGRENFHAEVDWFGRIGVLDFVSSLNSDVGDQEAAFAQADGQLATWPKGGKVVEDIRPNLHLKSGVFPCWRRLLDQHSVAVLAGGLEARPQVLLHGHQSCCGRHRFHLSANGMENRSSVRECRHRLYKGASHAGCLRVRLSRHDFSIPKDRSPARMPGRGDLPGKQREGYRPQSGHWESVCGPR